MRWLQPNVPEDSEYITSPLFWALACVTGVCAGLASGLLMLLFEAIQHLAWSYRPGDDFLAAVAGTDHRRAFVVVALAGCLAALFRTVLWRTRGGGTGTELVETIWFQGARMKPLRTLAQGALSIIIVAMGASLGRESAPKQYGALAGSLIGGWAALPPSQRRLLVACGAGGGFAAVYNVPLGGAMFALEALLGEISLSMAPAALLVTCVATMTSWLLLPNVSSYHVPPYPLSADQLLWAALIGPAAGIADVAYVRLICFADRQRPSGVFAALAPLAVFSMLGLLSFRYPELLGNGKGVTERVFLGEHDLTLLTTLLVLRPLACAACLGSGAPGGLFTPTLTVGALVGAICGRLWLQLWPGAPLGGFAIVGASAFLAGATQGPISAIVLVSELTHGLDLIVPSMLAVGGATLTARLFESRSIYSGRVQLGRLAATRAEAAQPNGSFITLSAGARIGELREALFLAAGQNRPVHVVDKNGALLGEVTAESFEAGRAVPLQCAAAADFVDNIGALEDVAIRAGSDAPRAAGDRAV